MRKAISNLGILLTGEEQSASLRQRLLTGLGGVLGLRVAFSGLSFSAMVLLAQLLGPGPLGAYTYSLSWIVLLAIPALMGADQLLVREVAATLAAKQWGLLHGLLRRANGAVFLVSAGLAVIGAAVAWLVGRESDMVQTFWMALPFLPLITLTRVRQAAMQGMHRVTQGAMPEQVIQPGLLLATLAAFLWSRHALTATTAMFVNVVSAAVSFTIGVWLLRRSLPAEVRQAAPEYRDREWTRSAFPLIFLAGVSALFAQADTLILGSLKGEVAVGMYGVAHKGADLIAVILNAQIAAFASTAASLWTVGDRERLQRLVTRLARTTLLLSAPVGIGLIVFGRWFLMLYGPGFVAAHTTLAILCLGQLANISTGCVGVLLLMTGHERQVAKAIGAGAIANVTLSFALATRFGPEGVAVAYAASTMIWNFWAVVVLYQKTGLHSTAFGRLPFLGQSAAS